MFKKFFLFAVVVVSFLGSTTSSFAKGMLSPEDLKKKKEGWYVTGLPLISYSSDDGFGYGVRLYLYNNGSRSDELFKYSPYFLRIYAQYYATTKGMEYHELNLDAPYAFGTKFRIRTFVAIDRVLNNNYFGIGDECYQPLYGGYKKLADAQKYLDSLYNDAGETMSKYYKYTIYRPTFSFSIDREFWDYFKAFVEYRIKKNEITLWDGKEVDINGNTYIQRVTLLNEDKPYGIDGGRTAYVSFGLAFDTRDYEPDPKRGLVLETVYEFYSKAFGSEYEFQRFSAGYRQFITLVKDLVLAYRLAYSVSWGDVPFFELGYIAFYGARREAIGGSKTARGFKRNRFIGRVLAIGNLELRYSFYEVKVASQLFKFMFIPFVDIGREFDDYKEFRFDDKWKPSYGAALRIAWNMATIINFSYGVSEEDANIAVDFDHQF